MYVNTKTISAFYLKVLPVTDKTFQWFIGRLVELEMKRDEIYSSIFKGLDSSRTTKPAIQLIEIILWSRILFSSFENSAEGNGSVKKFRWTPFWLDSNETWYEYISLLGRGTGGRENIEKSEPQYFDPIF